MTAVFAPDKLSTIILIYKEDGESQPQLLYQKYTDTNIKKLFVAAHGKNRNGHKTHKMQSNTVQQQ